MKAYSLYSVGDLRYEEREYPEISNGWCVVKVMAAGICSSDIPRIFTKGTYHFPTIPGHEFSGVVDSVFDKQYEKYIGERVGIFPLIPCKVCLQCQKQHYEMCEHYDYIGSRRDGAFAEYVAVPVWNLMIMPKTVSFEAIALMEPMAVALHAMCQGGVVEGLKVGIIGTGMIALAAAQWSKLMGANSVTVVGRSEGKRHFVEQFDNICYSLQNDIDQYDIVLEAVGSNQAINKAINLVKAGGRLILMGNPEGDIKLGQDTYWRILRKQISVIGTWNSTYGSISTSDWNKVMDNLIRQTIQVKNFISHFYQQDNLKDGLMLMKNHIEPYTKVMTLWNCGEEEKI